MSKGYENFNNSETSFRKSTLIQERIGLVSTHMYKQFLDYQHATLNTAEIFVEMIDNLKAIADSLKQSFSARGITTENIYVEYDKDKTVVVINILWHTISLTTRCNYEPQALFRESAPPMFSGRIMAINGNYNELMEGISSRNQMMEVLLDKEVASLFVPADKTQNSIFKIRHLSNREFLLSYQITMATLQDIITLPNPHLRERSAKANQPSTDAGTAHTSSMPAEEERIEGEDTDHG